jgi:spore coat protein A, manganese oxidase
MANGRSFTRRRFLQIGGGSALGLFLVGRLPNGQKVYATVGSDLMPDAPLDAAGIAQYAQPLLIPPAMPRTSKLRVRGGKNIDYYEIAVRQFDQQILPPGMPATTVWGYGSATTAGTFNAPSFTIEAKWGAPVRVKWMNELRDGSGQPLPHLLPVDPTLHWANPGAVNGHIDSRPDYDGQGTPDAYQGPVPVVTHVHGALTNDESDGYAEAWYLPPGVAWNYHDHGTWYEYFAAKFKALRSVGHPSDDWAPGSATFEYPNEQGAGALWYHDHTLGMTRLNVYAGPAGFYLLRGGPSDVVLDSRNRRPATLPGPAPALGDRPGVHYGEIPLAIQDRSFRDNGQLFYPDSRAFFEGLDEADFADFPFIGEDGCTGPSDVSPIWNPEFFGNSIIVNGRVWPRHAVNRQRYRLRLLNGCNSRTLILTFSDPSVQFWVIGNEGGFLSGAPVSVPELVIGPAERYDVIVDFAALAAGTSSVELLNVGPDAPFTGLPVDPAEIADPATTGRVMQFSVGAAPRGGDKSTPPTRLVLPARVPLVPTVAPIGVGLYEEESGTVTAAANDDESWVTPVVAACDDPDAVPFGPTEALLGPVPLNPDGTPAAYDDMGRPGAMAMWSDAVTENPNPRDVVEWYIFNTTMDVHPIHIHEVMFQVLSRETKPVDGDGMPVWDEPGAVRGADPWETGLKDTVLAYPGEVTRIVGQFSLPGRYVWHCHIVEHEDNEMMRPYNIGALQPYGGIDPPVTGMH